VLWNVAQHNIFHVGLQQFSQFVLLDMFDSKIVWHLWATISGVWKQ